MHIVTFKRRDKKNLKHYMRTMSVNILKITSEGTKVYCCGLRNENKALSHRVVGPKAILNFEFSTSVIMPSICL